VATSRSVRSPGKCDDLPRRSGRPSRGRRPPRARRKRPASPCSSARPGEGAGPNAMKLPPGVLGRQASSTRLGRGVDRAAAPRKVQPACPRRRGLTISPSMTPRSGSRLDRGSARGSSGSSAARSGCRFFAPRRPIAEQIDRKGRPHFGFGKQESPYPAIASTGLASHRRPPGGLTGRSMPKASLGSSPYAGIMPTTCGPDQCRTGIVPAQAGPGQGR